MALDLDRWVPLAEIARPHGVRGELKLKLFNAESDVLLEQDEVLVRLPDGTEHEVSVDKARRADDAILMKLHSVDDRDRADELRGAQICLRRRDFPPLEEGEYYSADLVGAEARMSGERLGVVKDVVEYPTVHVLVVNAGDKTWEIPMNADYIGTVDLDGGVVEVRSLDELEPSLARKAKPAEPTEKRVPKWKAKRDAEKAEKKA